MKAKSKNKSSVIRRIVIAGVLIISISAFGVFFLKQGGISSVRESSNTSNTLYLWYTDDSMTDYLNSVVIDYNETHNEQVVLELKSGKEFLQAINDASLQRTEEKNASDQGTETSEAGTETSETGTETSEAGTETSEAGTETSETGTETSEAGTETSETGTETSEAGTETETSETEAMPDLYFITNDALEQASLAGLTSEIQDNGEVVTTDNYSQSAIDAVTYDGKVVAYPIYYDTSVLLYNKTYMEEYAEEQLEAEADQSEGEAAQAALDASETEAETNSVDEIDSDGFTQAEIDAELEKCLPKTIEELEEFASGYDAPTEVESVFKWDVSNILYNYNFVGNYMNIGGEDGDDPDQIDIYNENAIASLTLFQNLNQFFSIDLDTINYDDVIQDFEDGKIVFTMAGTDAIQELEEAQEEGEFNYDYGVLPLLDLNDSLQSRALSITTGLVVNGYSEKKADANNFAIYLATQEDDSIYTRAQKASSNLHADLPYGQLAVYQDEYDASVPIPKMMSTSNLWMRLEIGFTDIWNGADAGSELKSIAESTMEQITGESETEETIVLETEETTDESSD